MYQNAVGKCNYDDMQLRCLQEFLLNVVKLSFANNASRRAINCRNLWLVNRVIFASVILRLIAPNSQTANHCRHTPRVFARGIGIKLATPCFALRNLRSSEIRTHTLDKYAQSTHTLWHTLASVGMWFSVFSFSFFFVARTVMSHASIFWHEQRGMYNDTRAHAVHSLKVHQRYSLTIEALLKGDDKLGKLCVFLAVYI